MKVFVEPMGIAPTRAHKTDAGLDLYCIDDTTVPARGSAVFRTGVHIELPPNTYGKLESKSGLNVVHDIVYLAEALWIAATRERFLSNCTTWETKTTSLREA